MGRGPRWRFGLGSAQPGGSQQSRRVPTPAKQSGKWPTAEVAYVSGVQARLGIEDGAGLAPQGRLIVATGASPWGQADRERGAPAGRLMVLPRDSIAPLGLRI